MVLVMGNLSSFEEPPSTTFDHVFSGWSVWLEPCEEETKELKDEMAYLSKKCGGQVKGVHEFPLHCTLLYNFTQPSLETLQVNESLKGEEHTEGKVLFKKENEFGLKMLNKCLETFEKNIMQQTSSDQITYQERDKIVIKPLAFNCFKYPKEADGGRGFGCVIPFLMLEKTNQLEMLHNATASVFPPDERHSNGGNFIPHMTLVYAPEAYEEWLMQRTEEMKHSMKHCLKPMRAKYLSLWSTEGTVAQWRRLARIKLM